MAEVECSSFCHCSSAGGGSGSSESNKKKNKSSKDRSIKDRSIKDNKKNKNNKIFFSVHGPPLEPKFTSEIEKGGGGGGKEEKNSSSSSSAWSSALTSGKNYRWKNKNNKNNNKKKSESSAFCQRSWAPGQKFFFEGADELSAMEEESSGYVVGHGFDNDNASTIQSDADRSKYAETTVASDTVSDTFNEDVITAMMHGRREAHLSPAPYAPSITYDDHNNDDNNGHNLPPGVTLRDQQEDAMMRHLAAQLRSDWATKEKTISPNLERRLRDFQFAQQKRREKYGHERPWGILGLYDHLAGIRVDLEWAEDAAWRRSHAEPYLSWTDFEESRDSGFNRPFFTYFLLFVCTVALIYSIYLNDWNIEPLKDNPMIGPSSRTLERMGAKRTILIVEDGEWYRLFSPMILHAGVIHYALNMLALWFIGSAVELNHGFMAAAILFVIPATGGNILSAIFLPEFITVGASGGIFGLIGACIADICINWNLLFSKQVNSGRDGTRLRHVRVLLWLLFDILINCLVGLTPFVDNFTHLGGMVYGFLCGLSTMERLPLAFFGVPTNCCSHFRNIMVRLSGLILSIILIMLTTGLLVDDFDISKNPCTNCRYVSCVPFPPWAEDSEKWWYCDDCGGVTADAKRNPTTGYFESMDLNCPNGDVVMLDLEGDEIADENWLVKQLPTFCRDECDDLFKPRQRI